MKIIRIDTELKLSVHEFPGGNYIQQNHALRRLIGNGCRVYEHVMPQRLYTELHMQNTPTDVPGQCVSMLVDEEGLYKEIAPNVIGSFLYNTAKHGNPIMGNVLFVGEVWGEDGIEFCGIDETVFEQLERQLNNIIFVFKGKGRR